VCLLLPLIHGCIVGWFVYEKCFVVLLEWSA
jgi:hypothetical protein